MHQQYNEITKKWETITESQPTTIEVESQQIIIEAEDQDIYYVYFSKSKNSWQIATILEAITKGQDSADYYCVIGKSASKRLAATFNEYKRLIYKYRLGE